MQNEICIDSVNAQTTEAAKRLGVEDILKAANAHREREPAPQNRTAKQIRLKNKCIEIGSCGECPFSKEYSIDMNYCSALSEHCAGAVPHPPCPGDYDIRKDCPLEDVS